MDLLSEDAIERQLAEVPGWTRSGDAITTTVQRKDFAAAMLYAAAVGHFAEAAGHHPDIKIEWNKVTLTLSTHSAGGLTEADFNLARRIGTLIA